MVTWELPVSLAWACKPRPGPLRLPHNIYEPRMPHAASMYEALSVMNLGALIVILNLVCVTSYSIMCTCPLVVCRVCVLAGHETGIRVVETCRVVVGDLLFVK